MSVRDAAGRDPRAGEQWPRSDHPGHGSRVLRKAPLQRGHVASSRRASRAERRWPAGAVAACVLATAFGAVASAGGLGRAGDRASATRSPAPTTVSLPGRVGDGPGIGFGLGSSRPYGDAPRRTDQAGAPSAASAGDRPPPCTVGDLPAPNAALDDWATTLVDTAFVLPDGYRPPDLVAVGRAGIGGGGFIRSVAIDDLRALAEAAEEAGNPLAVQSAYRSRSRQAAVFAGWVASSGAAAASRFSARPGHSEHQLGTALDLRAASGGAPWAGSFGSTAAGRWLARHATEFGFVLSYPAGAEASTCYGAEPWHIRYTGREIASEVAASGLTLREWLWRFGGR